LAFRKEAITRLRLPRLLRTSQQAKPRWRNCTYRW